MSKFTEHLKTVHALTTKEEWATEEEYDQHLEASDFACRALPAIIEALEELEEMHQPDPDSYGDCPGCDALRALDDLVKEEK